MAVPVAQIIKDVQIRVAGLQTAFTTDGILSAINEGQNELWKALVSSPEDYFVVQSQATDTTKTTYFPALSVTSREYTLPSDCLRPRFIEVTLPAAYAKTEFLYRKINHPDFQDQRRGATVTGSVTTSSSLTPNVYYYTIVGKNTLELAKYPEQAFTLVLWYVRALPLLAVGSAFDETVAPFADSITTFAVKRLMAIKGNANDFAVWSEAWRSSIVQLVQNAGPRSDTNPQYAAEANY